MVAAIRYRSFHTARLCWVALVVLTLLWDGYFVPLETGRVLLAVKLLPLLLPLRGIWSGRIYTYQYCSMLVLAYFTEGVMRLWDTVVLSRWLAAAEIVFSLVFFVACLVYLKQFKRPKKGDVGHG